MEDKDAGAEIVDSGGLLSKFVSELVDNPINLVLLGICGYLLYRIIKGREEEPPIVVDEGLPPFPKRDMTVAELRQYNGTQPDGRILMAVNGNIFDVTRGNKFYGPGGPYGIFAGRDASRGLANFALTEDVLKDEYDDISDLNSMQMDTVRDWEMQFKMKYDLVGQLIKPEKKPAEAVETLGSEASHGSLGDETAKPATDAGRPFYDAVKLAKDADKPATDAEKPANAAEKPANTAGMPANDAGQPEIDAEKLEKDTAKPANDKEQPANDAEKSDTKDQNK